MKRLSKSKLRPRPLPHRQVTEKEMADILLEDGEVIEQGLCGPYGLTKYTTVKAFGHAYKIENPRGERPRVIQLGLRKPEGW